MHKVKQIYTFLKWLKLEHINDASTQETYQELSKDSNYDNIIDYDRRTKELEKLTNSLDIKGKSVLDLACGTGAFITAFLKQNPKEVVGVDITAGMLAVAKNRFKNNANVYLINKSFMDVEFDDNSFDFVVMANASRYIPSGQEDMFFTKVKKWLKDDGIFIIHGDFWGGNLGKIIEPVLLHFTNKTHVNPATTFSGNLEKELLKHFEIFRRDFLQGSMAFGIKHSVFFCKNLSD
jgi:ubiquinone/menaquinone biosynthesis C-methylase UbiE